MQKTLIALGLFMTAGAATSQDAPTYTPPAKRVAPQDGLNAQLVAKGDTPRLANGVVDLNGLWGPDGSWDSPYPRFMPRSLEVFEPDQVAMQRANVWSRPLYKPELWQKVFDTDFSKVADDPAFHCMPMGVPRKGMPSKIVQTPKEVVLIYGDEVRYVPTDGTKHTEVDADFYNYGGVPVGRFEGDTLIVESIGFTDTSWLQWTGYFHSGAMKLTEKFTRKGDLLYYTATVDDPEVLVKPWTSATLVKRLVKAPGARLDEAPPCQENDAEHIGNSYYRG